MWTAGCNTSEFVAALQSEDEAATTALYKLVGQFQFGVYCFLEPSQLEDVFHESFVEVLSRVKGGILRNPGALYGYVRTVVRRTAFAHVRWTIGQRNNVALDSFTEVPLQVEEKICLAQTPEQILSKKQSIEAVFESVDGLSVRDQEILHRVYRLGESPGVAAEGMGMKCQTTFRGAKCLALRRLRFLIEHPKHRENEVELKH